MTAYTTALYRIYDLEHRLIYVGISGRPQFRMATHRARQPWKAEIASWTIEWYADRPTAEAAEAIAIRDEAPKYNRSDAATKLPTPGTVLTVVPAPRRQGPAKVTIYTRDVDADIWSWARQQAERDRDSLAHVVARALHLARARCGSVGRTEVDR